MRIVAEYLPDTSRILVRLLGTLSDPDLGTPATFVQTGTYIVDGTPQISRELSFDVTNDDIVSNETKLYFSGYKPLPNFLVVTLPDLTTQQVPLGQVIVPEIEILAQQKTETNTPVEKELHHPNHTNYHIDEMSPAEIPQYWFELNFAQTNPLRITKDLSSSVLKYDGGAKDRSLTATIAQEAEDYPPWKQSASVFLEGEFTNNLEHSSLEQTSTPPGFFDEFPEHWHVSANDPETLLRFKVGGLHTILPHIQIVYYLRSTFLQSPSIPVMVIDTPPVAANNTFQILVETSKENDVGTIRLVSSTGVNSTAQIPLIQGSVQAISLNVGADAGPVRIQWFQRDNDYGQQRLTIFAPQSSEYDGIHSWVPYQTTSKADVIKLENITKGSSWFFNQGHIRMESEQEADGQPLSWSLVSSTSNEVFLQVNSGILSSDFSSTTVDLRPLLLTGEARGSYRLKWRKNMPMKLITKLPDQPEVEVDLPFTFTSLSQSLLDNPLTLELRSYSPTEGSSRIKYFGFSPI